MTGTLHVIGAGVAGLACAVTAVQAGRKVAVYEATKHAGGRCRTFFDPKLGVSLDNGSHAVLGSNPAVFSYLEAINAEAELVPIGIRGEIPFVDVQTGANWTLRPNAGLIPRWIFKAGSRAPGTDALDYLQGLRLLIAGKTRPVSSVLTQTGMVWHNFWEPFTTAIMNTEADKASAHLLGAALRKTLLAHEGGLRAFVPKISLSDTFITPALNVLSRAQMPLHYSAHLVSVMGDAVATGLRIRSETISLGPLDAVILAIPPWSRSVQKFISESFQPRPSPIINVHFLAEGLPALPTTMTGIVGGLAHWIFTKPGLISVTVSADQSLSTSAQDEIARKLWADVCVAMALGSRPVPSYRVIIERRATPLQDTAFANHRPSALTHLENVYLAGDWTNTGLPCTLESAVRSGITAAKKALESA
jgi:hydroxysqualene dehydroxylase